MNKQGFPRGNPPEDCQKLRVWWGEEMLKCGLSGEVAIEFARVGGQPPAWSGGKQVFESLIMGREATVNTYMYATSIPGAPWPLEAIVMTAESGTITDIFYRAVLKSPISAEVSFKKSIGWLGDKLEVEGPGAERLRDRKPLLKKIKEGLSRRYEPPLWGLVASTQYLELGEASVTLRPSSAGCEAVVHTTARSERAFVGHNYTLGLDRALEILRADRKSTRLNSSHIQKSRMPSSA